MRTLNSMKRMGAVVAILSIVASIIQIGRAANLPAVEQQRTLSRRQTFDGAGSGDGITKSLGGLVDSPLDILNGLSAGVTEVADSILSRVSSPVTLSGNIIDTFPFLSPPIVPPLVSTLVTIVEALDDSPGIIRVSLCGGVEHVVDGITGGLSSPLTISSESAKNGIEGILSSPSLIPLILSGSAGEVISGILRVVSSPLTISGHALDERTYLSVKSLANVLPKSLQISLPFSISRGIDALIDSPKHLVGYFGEGFELIVDGITGAISSPLKICGAILHGDLNVHKDSPLIFPEQSAFPISLITAFLASPLFALHAALSQLGVVLSGVLSVVSSPLLLSGNLLDHALNVDALSPNTYPEESDIGQPNSFYEGIRAFVKSPMTLSSILSDDIHLLPEGLAGLVTSPITALCGLAPFQFPGSANNGFFGLVSSPFDFANLASGNVGYTLAGLIGQLSSPVTLSTDVLRESVNFNGDSLNVLPEQLEMWGIANSIAKTVPSFLAIPFNLVKGITAILSSPLSILDLLGIANVPGSPNSPPIFPLDFPEEMPADDLPAYVHHNPSANPVLSASVEGPGESWFKL